MAKNDKKEAIPDEGREFSIKPWEQNSVMVKLTYFNNEQLYYLRCIDQLVVFNMN